MLFLTGCLLSLFAGAGIVLLAQIFFLRTFGKQAEHTTTPKPESEGSERIRKQWMNFLSYDGSDQNGAC